MSSGIRPRQYPGGDSGTRAYQIQEFAQLAGTTVRALQHYDRLGLLSPVRAATGARLYSTADLQALVQILALKSIGVPLKRIARLRALGARAMAEALEAERRALERKQPLIDRVIFAIRNVESALDRGEDADPAVLGPLMAALKSEEPSGPPEAEAMASERSPAWDELQQEWRALLHDIQEAGDLDLAGPEMQALAARWDLLMTRATGGGTYQAALVPNAEVLESPSYGRANSTERLFASMGVALSRWAISARDARRQGR